jgi:hypothetical protein
MSDLMSLIKGMSEDSKRVLANGLLLDRLFAHLGYIGFDMVTMNPDERTALAHAYEAWKKAQDYTHRTAVKGLRFDE